MSFEKTNKSIENLSQRDVITLDLLFEMMVCVSQDVMKYNETSDLSKTPIEDCGKFLKMASSLMQLTLSSYNKNKDGLSDFSTSTQERYAKLIDTMSSVLSEMSAVSGEIKIAEDKQAELKVQQAELEKTRGHLLTVHAECDALQQKIDILSDSALDAKAKEKETLEKDLAQRTARAAQLDDEKVDLVAQNTNVQNQITTTKDSIRRLNVTKAELTAEKNELLAEKNGLEKGLENFRQKLREYQMWIENYPTMSKQIQAEHDEEKAKIQSVINAINSAMSEDFLKENLFKTLDASDNLSVESYPDFAIAKAHFQNIQDLQQWFDNMRLRIHSLTTVYETMLQALVSQSALLTKDPNT